MIHDIYIDGLGKGRINFNNNLNEFPDPFFMKKPDIIQVNGEWYINTQSDENSWVKLKEATFKESISSAPSFQISYDDFSYIRYKLLENILKDRIYVWSTQHTKDTQEDNSEWLSLLVG